MCCWSDENLSSKKIVPGYQFPSKSKKWLSRVRTSDESMSLMVSRMQTSHESQMSFMRKKPDLAAVESMAERAAAVWNLAQELLHTAPVKLEDVQAAWLTPWANGSEHVDVEVQVLVMDKSEDFTVHNVPTFKKILDKHLSSPSAPLASDQQLLEADEFQLLMKQLVYDVKVYETWQAKCSSVYTAREHALHELRSQRRAKANVAALALISSFCKFLTWDATKSETVIGDIMSWRREAISQKLGITQDIPAIVFLNWAAPCLVASGTQTNQIAVMTWALHDNMQSAGLVLSPVFSYNRGRLHLEETKMIDWLSKGNHNLDWQFSLVFKDKVDDRDMRPMVYPGRFIFPSPLGDPRKNMWFSCALRKGHRTKEATQVAPKHMKEIEDMADDALPTSTDEREGRIHGAQKYNQIGMEASAALLEGMLDQVNLNGQPAVMVIDLYPKVGDMLEAFCHLRPLYTSVSLFYIGICENQVETTWLQRMIQEKVAVTFEAVKSANNAGDSASEPNQDELNPLPKLPAMSRLIVNGKHELQIPVDICKKWQYHDAFKSEFTKWMDVFAEKYSVVDPSAKPALPASEGTPQKRLQGEAAEASPYKKARLGDEYLVDVGSITEPLLAEAKITSKDAATLQLRANHQVYIVNTGTAEWKASGCFLAGFGKGSFKLLKTDQPTPEGSKQFELTTSEDLVVFNGVVMQLGKVVDEARAKRPDIAVCYHKCTTDNEDPKKFKLSMTHKIIFVPRSDESDKTCSTSNIGKMEPLPIWDQGCLHTLWCMRWAAKGLMPVKPVVHLNGNCVLPAGKACRCNK